MRFDPEYNQETEARLPFHYLWKLGQCLLLEFFIWVLFYGIYTETVGLLSDVYLSELSGIGSLFMLIDEEMTVSNLLAGILAFFSVSTPVYIWSMVLKYRIHEDPQAWLSKPLNRIYAMLAGFIFLLVFGVEIVNLYTLIAQNENSGPLPGTGSTGELMQFLSQNKGLGIFVSFLMAIINAVIALITAKAFYEYSQAKKENF